MPFRSGERVAQDMMGVADMPRVFNRDRRGGGIPEPMGRNRGAEGARRMFANPQRERRLRQHRCDLGHPERIGWRPLALAFAAEQYGPVMGEVALQLWDERLWK